MGNQKSLMILGILVGIIGGFVGLVSSESDFITGIIIFLFAIGIGGLMVFYAQFDLLYEMNDHLDRIEYLLEYSTDRFDEETQKNSE